MIRRLTDRDRKDAIEFLQENPSYNLYLLGNIAQLGFDTEYCEFWGDFAESGSRTLQGVLNRYMSGWSVFGLRDADWHGMAAIIDDHPVAAARLQDNPGGVDSFLLYLTGYAAERVLREQLMELSGCSFHPHPAPAGCNIRRAVLSDLAQLAEFYADAGTMTRSLAAVERPLRDSRIWVAEIDSVIRAAALTNAEIAHQAMIGGVYTHPIYRGRGAGKAVCSALCAELLQEGIRPVLYWQTSAAGSIYRSLGFRAVGYWRSVWLRRR